MRHLSLEDRSTMIITDTEILANSFAEDVDKGLKDSPKHIPCLYFYDYKGSLLFEEKPSAWILFRSDRWMPFLDSETCLQVFRFYLRTWVKGRYV